MIQIAQPFQNFVDKRSLPLDNGYVYIGAANQNPETNPISVYWDAALTIPAAQPIRTINGYMARNGSPARLYAAASVYSITVRDSSMAIIITALDASTLDNLRADLASSSGGSFVYTIAPGSDAVARTVESKLRESPTVADRGTAGDGAANDTTEIISAVSNLPQRGKLTFTQATAYKITDTIEVFGKAGAVIDFGNQQINASAFPAPAPALHFKGISQAVIDDIFVIGHITNVTTGVLFDADASNITIHAKIGKVYAAACDTGIVVGALTHQFSDSQVEDIYASDCVSGIRFTGENTLAMDYGRVSAYNNTSQGVHFEQGGGTIRSLQVAASGTDLYFGSTSGAGHGKLARWDILGGYSEEGVSGERFIDSAACTDSDPFYEQICISGFRCTPFSSTNVVDFIRWRLNGDLILEKCSINHGQQEPLISLDHNALYRAPRVIVKDCVIDCNPKTSPQVMMGYRLTDNRQTVEINAQVNNGMSWWNNSGAVDSGVIKRGVYMSKMKAFEQSLLGVGNIKSAWSLHDATSGSCKNMVLGGPTLQQSAALERRDVWMDDGLFGIFRNGTTSKTLSTTSATLAASAAYTFGCIIRPVSAGTDDTDYTSLGGVAGIRLGIGSSGGNFAVIRVGAVQAAITPTSVYDSHLLVGRYVSGSSVTIDAINLRTGEVLSSTNVAAIPAFGALVWSNGVSIRNDLCIRGMPFVYDRALTDIEVSGLLQSALSLTDSWRLT